MRRTPAEIVREVLALPLKAQRQIAHSLNVSLSGGASPADASGMTNREEQPAPATSAPRKTRLARRDHRPDGSRLRDFFICHASEDKAEVARPLAHALKDRGFDVWYDEFELRVGDSLTREVDRGLAKVGRGIVILSRAFFGKEWPQRELGGLVARQVEGKTKILPIWHRLTRADVAKRSPMLADIKAGDTRDGIDRLADTLIASIRHRGGELEPAIFRGSHHGRMSHGGLQLPRSLLRHFDGHAYVTSLTGESARIYPMHVWLRIEGVLNRMPSSDRTRRKFIERTAFYGGVAQLGLNGMVQFDERLCHDADLDGQVVILGQRDFLDVWNFDRMTKRFLTDTLDDEDFRRIAEQAI